MSYLIAAYALATVTIAGYVFHLVRQAQAVTARVRELEEEA